MPRQFEPHLEANSPHEELPPLSKTLLLYLNVGFYTLQYPYRLSFNSKTGELKVGSPHYSKGLYAAVAITAEICVILVQVFGMLEPSLQTESNRSEFQHFLGYIVNAGWHMATAMAKFEFWRSADRIKLVFHAIITMERTLYKWTPHLLWIFKYPLLTSVFAHVNMVCTTLLEMSQGYQNGNGSVQTPVEHGLLGHASDSLILQVLLKASIFYETQLFHFASRLACLLGLIMFNLGCSYSNYVRQVSSDQERLETCKGFIKLSFNVKSCFDMTILGSCLLLLPYFAMRLSDVVNGVWTERALYFCYGFVLFVTLFAGAAGHVKISACVELLKTRGEEAMDGNIAVFRQRTIVLKVADDGGVGIRSRCVTLNYSFFAAVMASILTYAIAIMQFHLGNGNN